MIFNASKFNSHWENKKLSELGTFNRGKSKHRPRNDKKLFDNGVYPLIQTGEVRESNLYIESHLKCYNDFGLLQSKLWPSNTLCITIAANIAETALLRYPMCFPDSVVGFIADKEKTSELFMHYVFTYIRKAIQNSVQGSIQDNINIDYLTNLNFKIPSKSYQDKIVDILGILDKKIELNNKINAELEAMAKLIYDYWFVQFDFPDANGKPYKSSGGKMVYNQELKREIPEGWEVGNVDKECTVRNGYAFKSESYTDSGYTIVRTKNFKDGSVEFGDMAYIAEEEALSFKRYELSTFDFLLVMVGASVGKNVIVNSNVLPALQNQNMWCFRSKHSAQHYTNQLLKRIVVEQLNTSSGSAREFFKKEAFKEAKFCSPDLTLKKVFCQRVDPIFNRIDVIKLENRQLTDLRDWLLPMLMNGQVTVQEK